MGILRRLGNLIRGFLSLFIGGIERKNPEIAFENAINLLTKKYVDLKQAAAVVVARRDDLQKRLEQQKQELLLTEGDLNAAVDQDQDDVALVLISRKQLLEGSIEDLERDLNDAAADADEAKSSLNTMKTEVFKLKDERDRTVARIKSVEARLMAQRQLEGFSVDAELKALEGVRETVNARLAEVQINKELKEADLDTKLGALREKSSQHSARQALEELKQTRANRALPPAKDDVIDAEITEVLSAKK